MNPIQLGNELDWRVACPGEGAKREIRGIYCCDLLSIVMGRAKADDAWFTVMANINTIAVAVLADVACVVLAEGMRLDADSLKKAEAQGVCVLMTESPVFEASRALANRLGL